MDTKVQETLDILQEECAEVIVEVSKCRRFGFNSVQWKTGELHSTLLEDEIGDVLAMVDILLDHGVIDRGRLDAAKQAKKDKLKKFSNIFN